MKDKAKDVAIRALKTFVQSSIAYLGATIGAADVFDKGVAEGLIIGALAAGISASWNGAIQPMLNLLKGGEVQ